MRLRLLRLRPVRTMLHRLMRQMLRRLMHWMLRRLMRQMLRRLMHWMLRRLIGRLLWRLMHWMLRRLMRRMLRRLMGRLLRRLMHRMVHGLAGLHRGRRGRAAEPAKLNLHQPRHRLELGLEVLESTPDAATDAPRWEVGEEKAEEVGAHNTACP